MFGICARRHESNDVYKYSCIRIYMTHIRFTCQAIRRRESNDVRDFMRADIDVAGFVATSLLEGGVDRYTHTHPHTHNIIHTCIHMYIHIYTYMYICICMHMTHANTHTHMYIYTYAYIHTYTNM